MTPKFSFIIAIAGVALLAAVPAWGKGQPVEPQWEQALEARSDALNRMHGLGDNRPVVSVPDSHDFLGQADTTYIDAGERALRVGRVEQAGPIETPGLFGGDDNVRLDPADVPVSTPTVSSGREIEWPQIGIGIGFGIVLVLGLMLALRGTRIRPLAH